MKCVIPSSRQCKALSGRLMQKLFQDKLITEVASSVVNKTGGGSTLRFVYLNQHAGDAHFIAL